MRIRINIGETVSELSLFLYKYVCVFIYIYIYILVKGISIAYKVDKFYSIFVLVIIWLINIVLFFYPYHTQYLQYSTTLTKNNICFGFFFFFGFYFIYSSRFYPHFYLSFWFSFLFAVHAFYLVGLPSHTFLVKWDRSNHFCT